MGEKSQGFSAVRFRDPKVRSPVIIEIHGGPRVQSRPVFKPEDTYLMSALGVAIIYPNIRGSTGFGKTFVKLDDGFRRADCTKDIGALLDWVKKQSDLDSNRVIVSGGSYGGYVALTVATAYADRLRGTIAISAPSNLATFLTNTDKSYQDRWRREFGDERLTKVRRFLESIAPGNNANKLKTPLLIGHGERDWRVPVSETKQMIEAARPHSSAIWSVLATNEGHGTEGPRTRDFLFFARILFVQKYLTDLQPAK